MDIKRYKILIVDDEQTILELLSDFLSQKGYVVVTTQDPLEAIDIVETGTIKIVLTDIKMPKMDGIKLLEEVKRINGLVQVIIMTGYGSLENTVRCLEQGANDYLLKPFNNMTEIKKVIDITIQKLHRWENVVKDIYTK